MGSMNFGFYPARSTGSQEWKHDWEQPYLEGTRDLIFRNTFSDIERILERARRRLRHALRVRVLRRRPSLQPRAFPRARAGRAAAVRADDLRHPRRHRRRPREPHAHEADRRPAVRRRLPAGRCSAPAATRCRWSRMGAIMGGNVRVGLEDSLYLGKGQLAESTPSRCAKIRAHPGGAVAGGRHPRRGAGDARAQGQRMRLPSSGEQESHALRGRHRRHLHRSRGRGRRAAACASTRARRRRTTRSGACSTCSPVAADGPGRRRAAELLGRGDTVHPRHDPRDQRDPDTATTARTAFLTTAGPSRHAALPRGRPRPSRSTSRAVSRSPTCRARSPSRCPSGSAPTARSSRPLDEAAVLRDRRRLARARGRGGRGLPACGRSSTRRTSCRVGELLAERLPGVAVHAVARAQPDPARVPAGLVGRDRRVAQAAHGRLPAAPRAVGCSEAGFGGRVLVVTSAAACWTPTTSPSRRSTRSTRARRWRRSPGATTRELDAGADTAIVADTGGTTYDVSLVRRGRIPWTRETLARRAVLRAHDRLPVGRRQEHRRRRRQHRVGRRRRPAACRAAERRRRARAGCYGRGGTRPTVTDACLVLGYLDPDYFLGGAMRLDATRPPRRSSTHVGEPLGLDVERGGCGDPRARRPSTWCERSRRSRSTRASIRASAVLIGGGGAAGLNAVAIARRLGCAADRDPRRSARRSSAAGALMST